MPRVDVVVTAPIRESFRVQQAAGLFDLPLSAQATERFSVELPDLAQPWDVGLIVGPSGSGKSTVARHAYRQELYAGRDWPTDRAVIDAFGQASLRQTIELLTAVGFSSPPSWVKPYQVLSCGEQFRCNLARALAGSDADGDVAPGGAEAPLAAAAASRPLVVFDEFTSVVDRNVARACSTAIAKGIRSGRIARRFVAVTCHYDVAPWLEADWVLDMATQQLARGRLRRPGIELDVHRCTVEAWRAFVRHHYLSGSLAPGARCYLATWNGEPVAFAATLPVIAKRNHRRFTRIVTLPDFQGMGIGMRFVAAVAQLHRAEGLRINLTSSHPAVIRHCRDAPAWRTVSVKRFGSARSGSRFPGYRSSAGRSVASFEYVGEDAQRSAVSGQPEGTSG